MTSETGKDKPAQSGAEQRPQATIDLKAKEIFPEGTAQPAAAQTTTPPDGGAKPRIEAKPIPPRPRPETDPGTIPPPEASTEPEEPRRSGVGGFLTNIAAGLLGAIVAIGAAYLLGALRDSDRLDALDRALASAQQRLAAVENSTRTAVNEGGSVDARMKTITDQGAALKQEITSLGGRLEAVENRPAAPAGPSPDSLQQAVQPLNARIADLENRVASLNKAQDALRASTGSAALTMAVQNLRRAVAEGKPFSTELKTLASLAPEPLEVAPLEARRDSGLASLAKLQRDFEDASKAALDAAMPSGDGTFTGDLLAKARNLVRVRPTGDVPGDGADAILARAGHRLDSGDLPAAIRETGELSGPPAEAMKPWLTEAKARAAADEALAKIEVRLMKSPGSDEHSTRGG